jgi:hypothetical protein
MPKTAVDEYGDSLAREDDVGTSASVELERPVDSVAETAVVKCGSQRSLSRGAALSNTTHAFADCSRGRDRAQPRRPACFVGRRASARTLVDFPVQSDPRSPPDLAAPTTAVKHQGSWTAKETDG